MKEKGKGGEGKVVMWVLVFELVEVLWKLLTTFLAGKRNLDILGLCLEGFRA